MVAEEEASRVAYWTLGANHVAPPSVLTLSEFVADLPVATARPTPSYDASNVMLVAPPSASVNAGPGVAGAADHTPPELSVERMTPLVLPVPAPVAINLLPVYAISEARVSAVPCAMGVHDAVDAADAAEPVVATIWLLPSPDANHLSPVNAIPVPSPEKHTEFDSRTVRHVPALPVTSRE